MKPFKPSRWDLLKAQAVPSSGSSSADYVELVRILLSAVAASVIMGATFACLAGVIYAQTGDIWIGLTGLAGTAISLARSIFLYVFKRWFSDGLASVEAARKWERAYAVLCFGFAILLGAFCARTFAVGLSTSPLLVTGLLFGYCSGVVARISIRSWIAIPCLLLAALPSVAVTGMHPTFEYNIFSIFMALFLAGGLESARYASRVSTRLVMMRREFADLARQDDLTGLPNRLALRLHLEKVRGPGGLTEVAVHCLDLDRFKEVNDRFGHPVGDELLKAVAGRLARLCRSDDLAVRLGGDEFIVLQSDVEYADQADMLARRIERALRAPYMIDGNKICVGTSIGFALAEEEGSCLEDLIELADAALYRAKRNGGGIASSSGGEEVEILSIAG